MSSQFSLISASVSLLLIALNENINLFYAPDKIVGGEAPHGTTIRAGGMVTEGSVTYEAKGLGVLFVLTDHMGSSFHVRYVGILPDLFREGQGVVVTGILDRDGVFNATQVLAKHDENYMPREIAEIANSPIRSTFVSYAHVDW